MDGKLVGMISQQGPLSWKVYVDSAANQKGSGVGIVLVSPEMITIEKSLRLEFSAINNKAEYEALLLGMTMVQRMGGKVVEMFLDSRLIVGLHKSSTRMTRGKLWAKEVASVARESACVFPLLRICKRTLKPFHQILCL